MYRVLVVEDDLWMQPLVHSAIRKAIPHVTIDWAESAEEAQRRAQLNHYSFILADINLKPNRDTGLDFWNFCKMEFPEIPFLLTSSLSIEDFLKKVGSFSPYYLPKPFSMEEFSIVIKNLVSHVAICS